MFITEIILEGFKSYPTRTVLKGFDRHFTGITGLNGSGKSNVLDALCFVMGLTNISLSRVRCHQEYIYKEGKHGSVDKASVTVIFDNSDAATSGTGLEHLRKYKTLSVTRTIDVNAQSKYWLNGSQVTLKAMHAFWQAAGLNVNNPTFLIQQGSVASFATCGNAKILDMIEEAVGTRTFEMRKATAQEAIVKHEAQLQAVQEVLDTDLLPRIAEVRKQRELAATLDKSRSTVEQLRRYQLAYTWWTNGRQIAARSEDVSVARQKVQIETESLAVAEQRMASLEAKVTQANEELKKRFGGSLKGAEDAAEAANSKLNDVTSERDCAAADARAAAEEASAEDARAAQLQAALSSAGPASSIGVRLAKFEAKQGAVVARQEEDEKLKESLRRQVELLQSGVVAARSGLSLADEAKRLLTEGGDARRALKNAQRVSAKAVEDVKVLRERVTRAEKAVEVGDYDTRLAVAEKKLTAAESAAQEHAQRQGALEMELSGARRADVRLKDALAARSKLLAQMRIVDIPRQVRVGVKHPIKGTLASLLEESIPREWEMAFETRCGLFRYIVTDTLSTAKEVLAAPWVTSRVDVLPLSNLSFRALGADVRARLPQGAVVLSDLLKFDGAVKNAFLFAFGSVIGCADHDTARAVVNMGYQAVCKDGTQMDPEGSVRGGQLAPQGVIGAIGKLISTNRAVEEAQAALSAASSVDVSNLTAQLDAARRGASEARHQQEMCRVEMRAIRDERSANDLGALARQASDAERAAEAAAKELQAAQQRVATVENDEKELESAKGRSEGDALASASKELASVEKRLKSNAAAARGAADERSQLRAAYESTEREAKEAREAAEAKRKEKAQLDAAVDALGVKVTAARDEVNTRTRDLEALQAQQAEAGESISSLKQDLADAKREAAERSGTLEVSRKECSALQSRLDALHNQRDGIASDSVDTRRWLEENQHLFGCAGAEFDFTVKQEVDRRLAALKKAEKDVTSMEREVDQKALGGAVHEQIERSYDDTVRRREDLLSKKDELRAVVENCSVKKREFLCDSLKTVNKNVGSMFRTLLPGADAKIDGLTNAAGDYVGAELKVAFNGRWKESLSELSGGQRSLLALSLILAILLFRPSPIYILDEVDAALDPCHTANIGRLLCEHPELKKSQFFVVSLKEGMYNQAKVLFKTKLLGEKSTIERFDRRNKADNRE